MTVSSTTLRSGPYQGNGSTVSFPYDFKVEEARDIFVQRREAGTFSAVPSSEYTVSGVGNPGGGQVVFAVAPPASQTIVIMRGMLFTQEIDFENQGPFFAETVERALDLSVLRDQQILEGLERSVKVPVGSETSDLDDLAAGILALSGSAQDIASISQIVPEITQVAAVSEYIPAAVESVEEIQRIEAVVEVNAAQSVSAREGADAAEAAARQLVLDATAGFTGYPDGLLLDEGYEGDADAPTYFDLDEGYE